MKISSELSFYQNLQPFSDFSRVTEDSSYVSVPAGWSLVMSDIKGSTKAIQSGFYKQVNLMGVATIAAYTNLVGTNDLPFVFGGDGATLLVPEVLLEELIRDLKMVQRIARKEFDLVLRVGVISVRELLEAGHTLKIAKYELSPGNYLAQMKGGALSFAEDWMKGGDLRMQLLQGEQESLPLATEVLEGLSCRLNPLRSTSGQMLTLLCKPTATTERSPEEIVLQVLEGITAILQKELKSASPVQSHNLHWPLFPKGVHNEVVLSTKGPYWLRWVLTTVRTWMSNSSMRFNIPMGLFQPRQYKKELSLNSDFKKYDETLRMVLDCTHLQVAAIEVFLKELHTKNRIVYGLHRSEQALMTCVVKSPVNNRHIHFIDGADGGYAMAALQMKKQLNERVMAQKVLHGSTKNAV